MSQGPIFGLRVTTHEVGVIGTALGILLEVLADDNAVMDTSTDAGMGEYMANLSTQLTASRLFGSLAESFGKSKEEVLDMLTRISHPTERNEK